MKWLRKPTDSLINYIADRFYDRLRDRALKDLEPILGTVLIKEAQRTLPDLFGWLP